MTATDTVVYNRPQSVGLVLSGGGAKGIAHVGVIRALEDAGIPIDYITGTSMGAIIGGLYACGYTTDEMMDLLLSKGFSYWSTGKTDPNLEYYFSKPESTPALLQVPINIGNKGKYAAADSVPASIINPLPMNFAFMELFAGYTAQCKGNFNNLFVPFRCVASDVAHDHKVVHRSGNLGDAIRTSMSFPLVFQPIKMDGNLLYDGGIFDNFPVDVMCSDFAPDIIIGVDVAASSKGPQSSLLDQVTNLVERPQSYELADSLGIKIRVNLDQFSLLDFPAAQKIYQEGYDKAMSMIDSVKSRVTSRISPVARNTARAVFKASSPYVRFDKLNVSGGTPQENRYIKYIFEPAHADTFGIAHARESYYRAISPGKLKNLFPQASYNDSTGLFTLNLKAYPKNNFNFGLGGYITSSTSSYLFLSLGYNNLRFSSINANLSAWIGQSYMAGYLNTSLNLPTDIPSALRLLGVVSRQRYFETDKLFFQDNRPSFIVGHDYFARLCYDLAAGASGTLSLSAGYGHLYHSFYRLDAKMMGSKAMRDHVSDDLGQLRLGYASSTLDNINYPTTGHKYNFTLLGFLGNEEFRCGDRIVKDIDAKPRWVELQIHTRNYWDVSKHFGMGVEAEAIASTRKLLGNYNADIVIAQSFNPTPASHNVFNHDFRANSFVAATLVPIYKYNSSLSARLNLSAFLPARNILPEVGGGSRYGNWFSSPRFFGELDIAYSLPIPATISAYLNYASAGSRPWSVGLSVGLFLHAPRFMR